MTGFAIDKPPTHHTNVKDKRSELQTTKRRQLAEKSAWSITQREPRQTLIRLSTHTCQNNNHKKKVYLEPADNTFCLKVIKNGTVAVVVYAMAILKKEALTTYVKLPVGFVSISTTFLTSTPALKVLT